MEWCVPLQKLELNKISVGSLITRVNREKKPMVPLSYVDGQVTMPVLTILLPHLIIDSYNPANGRLELAMMTNWIASKLTAIQTSLLEVICASQVAWFGTSKFSREEVYRLFQPMVEGNKLHLYCPSTLQEKRKGMNGIRIWRDGVWVEDVQPGFLTRGQIVRVTLQIQGMSLQMGVNDTSWTGRARLQHRILGILVQAPRTPECLIQSSEELMHSLK
jgi:hypothetical protein